MFSNIDWNGKITKLWTFICVHEILNYSWYIKLESALTGKSMMICNNEHLLSKWLASMLMMKVKFEVYLYRVRETFFVHFTGTTTIPQPCLIFSHVMAPNKNSLWALIPHSTKKRVNVTRNRLFIHNSYWCGVNQLKRDRR